MKCYNIKNGIRKKLCAFVLAAALAVCAAKKKSDASWNIGYAENSCSAFLKALK